MSVEYLAVEEPRISQGEEDETLSEYTDANEDVTISDNFLKNIPTPTLNVNRKGIRSNTKSDLDESSESTTLGGRNRILSNASWASLDLDVPSTYEPVVGDSVEPGVYLSEEEEDHSIFQAQLLSNCQDVRLVKDEECIGKVGPRRKIISITSDLTRFDDDRTDLTASSLDISHLSPDDPDLDQLLDSDDLQDAIITKLDELSVEAIPELTAAEEASEARAWRSCVVGGSEKTIDLRVLEPYKRVVSHGGYLSQGSRNAIIVFSACYLPDRSRVDYDYVMSNLFLYVISTLDQLVTDDYILVYLHGATTRSLMPKFSWLKQCYHMINRKLRKNLKGLYLVHPTFWLKTLVIMTRPFISSKFSRKLCFVSSLGELFRKVPLERASIPDRVLRYDILKESFSGNY